MINMNIEDFFAARDNFFYDQKLLKQSYIACFIPPYDSEESNYSHYVIVTFEQYTEKIKIYPNVCIHHRYEELDQYNNEAVLAVFEKISFDDPNRKDYLKDCFNNEFEFITDLSVGIPLDTEEDVYNFIKTQKEEA